MAAVEGLAVMTSLNALPTVPGCGARLMRELSDPGTVWSPDKILWMAPEESSTSRGIPSDEESEDSGSKDLPGSRDMRAVISSSTTWHTDLILKAEIMRCLKMLSFRIESHVSPQQCVHGWYGHKHRVDDDKWGLGVEDVQGGLDPGLHVPPLKVHNDTDLDTCPPQRELVMCLLIACHKERKNNTKKNKQVCTHRLLGRSDGQQGTGAKPGMRAWWHRGPVLSDTIVISIWGWQLSVNLEMDPDASVQILLI